MPMGIVHYGYYVKCAARVCTVCGLLGLPTQELKNSALQDRLHVRDVMRGSRHGEGQNDWNVE